MPELEIKQYTIGECGIAIIYIIVAIILAIAGSIYLYMYAEYASTIRAILSLVCNAVIILIVGGLIAKFCDDKGKAIGVSIAALGLQLLAFCLFVSIRDEIYYN